MSRAKALLQPKSSSQTSPLSLPGLVNVTMPLPPSGNHRLMAVGSRMVKTAEYRRWLDQAANAIRLSLTHQPKITTSCFVVTGIVFPDRRKRDVDNVIKCVNDALVQGGAIEDDSLIHLLVVQRLPVDKTNSRVDSKIWPIDESLPSALKPLLSLI